MYEREPPSDRDAEVEELLAGGLAAAGARGGRKGAGAAGASGGAAGGRFASRFLRIERHEQEIELANPPAEDVLAHLGEVVWAARAADGGYEVRGLVGSGWLDMNPTVVDVDVRPDGRTTVRAAAKEGLINQKTAPKAVRRVVETLYSAAPPS
jgi:hypothetical protein